MKKFRIGTDDFKEFIEDGGYFVDKSLLIRDIIEGNKVTLIPRPRRFGKTLNMTMLRYFFERSEESRSYLFKNCAIADFPQYMQHQGQYPVIYISLKDLKRDSYEYFIEAVRIKIGSLYKNFAEVQPVLSDGSRERFHRIIMEEATLNDLYSSLKDLITHCYQYYKKPVIVLIDEYDTPMIEAFSHGYYDKMAGFMRSWLGEGLKPEYGQVLFRAVVTGILRVAKESIFSDLNNLDVASSLMIGPYADKFGFTEPELSLILSAFQAEDHAGIIRDWYNGYSFGGHTIYNPWSVISYIQAIPNPPGPKWLNTSSNALVYEELEAGGLEIKRDLEVLLAGEELRYPISENIIFTDIGRNPVNIWSLLYYSGYLNAEDPQPDLRGRLRYRLRIPNREISYAYEHFIESLYRNTDGGLDLLLHCFLGKRPILQIGPVLQDLTRDLVSMYDLAKLPEAVFHAFVLGLLANLRTVYEIRSNAEAGFGRADILMIPKTRDYPTAYVIEFKTTDGQQNTEIVSDALNQIRNQEYEAALSNAGISDEQIVRLAIILQGKEVRVATGYYAGVMNVQPKRRYVL
ncbi:protein of unknown function DUF1703 [Methanospirillum hungatei JF-1]|uniref:AAA-ATPase-like domain-containing protein n=2 Tax=Methanospirillum hungatei TaxID=2203 RepID=Q2FQ62_METHJ|nr:ATP-binding protein [Methanospirillum hungatei]ABD41568.1 protein of unknown function DUF1703 [Methanospirillum hungatei JF-1]MBP9008008.1 ATP-binding protein [Methanospirillum sp.]OQA54707.1 MAG: putative AAA-ATPase [Euryarchaeota archaeon ADurb.Bin294]